MNQEMRRQQTTRLLLDTTKALIAELGCDSVTMKHIMERSGLSKGAIFHYVKTKDELFAMVLQEKLEDTDRRFRDEVEQGDKSFEGPFKEIAEGLTALENSQDIANKVFMYLLGKTGQPVIEETLTKFYEQSVRLSEQWIAAGQRHGVIPDSVEASKAAELFVLISLGLRVRSAIPSGTFLFKSDDFSQFLADTLRPR